MTPSEVSETIIPSHINYEVSKRKIKQTLLALLFKEIPINIITISIQDESK